MSENYDPGVNVTPEDTYATVLLSQRDAALRVPVNFVTSPGVSLTAACFHNHRYHDDASGDCLSNLLAVGFRRFEIDLYWDEGRKLWSFCPVALPASLPNLNPLSTFTISSNFTRASAPQSSISIPPAPAAPTTASSSDPNLRARQITPSITLDAPSITTTPPEPFLEAAVPSVLATPDYSNHSFVSIGPYVCTTTINLSVFYTQLIDYAQKTQTTLGAHLIYIILNIHAAASANSPTSPAPEPALLPDSSQLLGNLFSGNLSQYIYSESDLFSDRADLNGSWFDVHEEVYRPVEGYYEMKESPNGILSTEDGWPSEAYITFVQGRRMLFGWGTIDPQMAGYNFSGDTGTIFTEGFIQDVQTDLNTTDEGQLTSGCFFRNHTEDLSNINSSWAVSSNLAGFRYPTTASSDLTSFLNLTQNTISCGISPHLNSTLLNSTADIDFTPYENFTRAAIWSWAPGEPRNSSSSSYTTTASTESLFRCATSSKDQLGRWIVEDCSEKRYAACRARGQPYNWTLASVQVSYSFAGENCPSGYDFAVPRTALENTYLTQVLRTIDRDFDGHGAWIDFNSLGLLGCWTTGGPNATCPWEPQTGDKEEFERRRVLVPAIGALILLAIFAIWLQLRCYHNHRRSKRSRTRTRRKGDDAIFYEGVPS